MVIVKNVPTWNTMSSAAHGRASAGRNADQKRKQFQVDRDGHGGHVSQGCRMIHAPSRLAEWVSSRRWAMSAPSPPGSEGVGLAAGELVERAAELGRAAHGVGQQHGRLHEPENEQRVLAQTRGRSRRGPVPAARQRSQQPRDEQRQVQAVADLAVGILERDVFEQARERQGTRPSRQPGRTAPRTFVARKEQKQPRTASMRVAVPEPLHGPERRGRWKGPRRSGSR